MEGVRIVARARSDLASDTFTQKDLSEAAGQLARAAREGRIRAAGVRYLDTSPSPLTAEDWMKLRIHENGALDDPHRDLRAFRVRITGVVVDARDIRKQLAILDAEPSAQLTAALNLPPAATASRRGRKPKYDWPAAEEAFRRRVKNEGWPEDLTNETGWQSQSDVERWIASILKDKPSESVIRGHVSRWLRAHRATRPEI